jgi:hypothetical protein
MKKNNFPAKQLLALCFSALLFSCNDNTEKKEDATATAADSTAATASTPAPAVFEPFDVMEISHKVKDYDKWKPAFNTDSTVRKANGIQDMVVGRSIDDPNKVIIALQVSDVQKAKNFGANPRLKEVMDKAGVISKPDVQFFHIIRFDPNSKEKTWVRVTHRVKDFDAWLKVYDNEGIANRASQGLIDVALGRGIDDPNIVTLVFDIKDLAKAKASISSEEKKKLMASAGVEGVPRIEFYKTAEGY